MKEQPRVKKVPIEDVQPWVQMPYEPADATAFQSLMRGDCPPHLQQRAMNYLLFTLCGLKNRTYHPGPDGDRATAFAEGKRFVGLQIGRLLEVKVNPGGEQP